MLNINIICLSSTNYYLLKCNDGYLLIDAGWVGKYGKFKRALRHLSIDVNEIRYVLLTHHHHDHAALIQNIRNETKIRIIVHEYEANYASKGTTYTDETNQYNISLRILDRIISPFIQYNYDSIEIVEDDIVISDDDYDIYSLTGIRGRIVHTPGHSKGSISLLLSNGDAFVGDVAMNMLKAFGQQYRPVEAESYSDVYKSWRKMIRYGSKIIYPSHGRRFSIKKLERILADI